NIVYGVFRNMPQGVAWAANALTVNDTRERLAGNFAVVNNKQVLSTDTRIWSTFEFIPPPSVPTNAPASSETILNNPAKPSWVLPAMVITGMLIIIIIVVVTASALLRRRKSTVKQIRDEEQTEE
ncbi:MAG TPA: hypothetical protein DCX54_09235, partial [Flavobacteriales bacterium]|nr:hypothetical protein [Flavobacteriales bacterium]